MPLPTTVITAIERRFRISLDADERDGATGSLLGLYRLVLRKLCLAGPDLNYRRARVFYRLRRAMVEELGLPREAVVPDAPLADLLPDEGRQQKWETLETASGLALPLLEPTTGARNVAGCVPLAMVVAIGLPLSCMYPWIGLPAVCILGLVAMAMQEARLRRSLKRHALLPEGCTTLRDLVDMIAPQTPPAGQCPSSYHFYRIRRALARSRSAAERQVAPSTPLPALLPQPVRAEGWQALQEVTDCGLPDLEMPWWGRWSPLPIVTIVILGYALSVPLLFYLHDRGVPHVTLFTTGVLSPVAAIVAAQVMHVRVTARAIRQSPQFPTGLRTVRDIVYGTVFARAGLDHVSRMVQSLQVWTGMLDTASSVAGVPKWVLRERGAYDWRHSTDTAEEPTASEVRHALTEVLAAHMQGELPVAIAHDLLRAIERTPTDPGGVAGDLALQLGEGDEGLWLTEAYWQWLRRVLAALRSEMPLMRMTLDRRRSLSMVGEEYLPFWDEQQWRQHEPLVSDISVAAPYHAQLRDLPVDDEPDEAAQGVGVASGFSVVMVEKPLCE